MRLALRDHWVICLACSSFFGILMTLLTATGCSPPGANKKEGKASESYIPDSGSVGFDVQSLEGSSKWLATYTSGGRTAKFKIELGPGTLVDEKPIRIESGKGRFLAVPGSDAGALLIALKQALEAKKLPSKARRVDALPFDFVNFGENLSHAPQGGGFSDNPPGNWTSLKIFVGEGPTEGEFFLNLNPVTRKGEFSIKDPDYGDDVIAQLAKVL
jgi:hypothetical protein